MVQCVPGAIFPDSKSFCRMQKNPERVAVILCSDDKKFVPLVSRLAAEGARVLLLHTLAVSAELREAVLQVGGLSDELPAGVRVEGACD